MPKKTTAIPVHHFVDEHNPGISIEKVSFKHLDIFRDAREAHRHDCHAFLLLEAGTVTIEIDFQQHTIKAPSIIYMHPNQVHLILSAKNISVYNLAITNEYLNEEYLQLLESLAPVQPLLLKKPALSIISETISLCIKFSEREQDKLFYSLLKNGCNALVALFISQYIENVKPVEEHSRFEKITKDFNDALERSYSTLKRPAEYAQQLNISVPYLNECVKSVTGQPVSYHIQQRIVLEAKRLLYHSNQSAKEIATALGYDDHRYFSRLFTKVAGMAPVVFRNKKQGGGLTSKS